MSEQHVRKSPLYRLIGQGVAGMSERAFEAQLILRGDGADRAFVAAVKSACGLELPLVPNTLRAEGAKRLCWLGPDEWQLTLAPGEEGATADALRAAFAGMHAAVVDVSDGFTVIVLEGADAAEILCRDCPLDFHPTRFVPGSCAQSVIGKSNALIVRESAERFAICVRRSFAEYLWTLLAHNAELLRRAAVA